SLLKATMEGVVRAPSAFSITLGAEPSMTATHELVVPRSMPITFAMSKVLSLADGYLASNVSALRTVPIENIDKTSFGRCPAGSRGHIGTGNGRCKTRNRLSTESDGEFPTY